MAYTEGKGIRGADSGRATNVLET